MPNSTTITNSTQSTITQTFTVTHTSTQQLAPSPFFLGIPNELWLVIIPVIGVVFYLVLKFNVKGVPVKVLWLAKNYSALQLRASEDLQGLWLTIINARGKKVETIKKTGKAIEVYMAANKNGIAYTLNERRKAAELDDATKEMLKAKGFNLQEVRKGRKMKLKGYIMKKDAPDIEIAYLDLPKGGMKHERMYTAVEGTGHTLDLLNWREIIDQQDTNESGSDGVIHQEINAAKSWLQLLAEAARASLGNTLLMVGGGFGIGGMVVMLALILTGHFK